LVCDQSLSVGLRMQDYKSLCLAVMICTTMVNTQTDRHKNRQLLTSYIISSLAVN